MRKMVQTENLKTERSEK